MKQLTDFKTKLQLISDYFLHSDERARAWLLLCGLIVCVILSVVLKVYFIHWTAVFVDAFIAKDIGLYQVAMKAFLVLIVSKTIVAPLINYLKQTLAIYWRQWLTIEKCKLEDSGDISNSDQRLEEEIASVVNRTTELGVGFFKSILLLVVFVRPLLIMSGSISFTILGINIFIPVYLVWVLVASTGISTVITYIIGSPLSGLNNVEENLNADFRKEMAKPEKKDDAPKIFFEKINPISFKIRNVKVALAVLHTLYSKILKILPYIASASLYFTGMITMDELTNIVLSFSQVGKALSWYVDSYNEIIEYITSISRCVELGEHNNEDALNPVNDTANVKQKVPKPRSSTQVITCMWSGSGFSHSGPAASAEACSSDPDSLPWPASYGGRRRNIV